MAKYKLKFRFEWGGYCIWANNDDARNDFGYPIHVDELPISDRLKKLLLELENEHDTSLNWEYPPDPSAWSDEQFDSFGTRSKDAYNMLVKELGDDFEVEYCVSLNNSSYNECHSL
ncbi:MAG: hypothetical protein BGN88_06570 [Clostridiales bacterium 43-6]|mgnify:CR=1 FL=1|nr:MAG: hypothetical protein BGN88_06570 [Clostridiales bacterium 43-6]